MVLFKNWEIMKKSMYQSGNIDKYTENKIIKYERK